MKNQLFSLFLLILLEIFSKAFVNEEKTQRKPTNNGL